MSQPAKKTKKAAPALKFSPEVQSLLDNSTTHPMVLVLKLAMDNLKRRYDAEAEVLLERREKLMCELYQLLIRPNPFGGTSLHQFWYQGADITIYSGFNNTVQYGATASQNDIAEMFKALDVHAPRSPKGGFNRVMGLKIYDKGPAFNLVAHCLFGGDSSGDAYKNLKSMLPKAGQPDGLSPETMRFGSTNSSVKFTNGQAVVRGGTTKGGSVTVYLDNLSPSLRLDLEELGKAENELVKRMYSDLRLLATRSAKIRSLDKIMRKMPDLIEHPELKLLLGYKVNPLKERVKAVTSVLTGEALLKAGV